VVTLSLSKDVILSLSKGVTLPRIDSTMIPRQHPEQFEITTYKCLLLSPAPSFDLSFCAHCIFYGNKLLSPKKFHRQSFRGGAAEKSVAVLRDSGFY